MFDFWENWVKFPSTHFWVLLIAKHCQFSMWSPNLSNPHFFKNLEILEILSLDSTMYSSNYGRRHYQLRWQGAKKIFFCQGEVVQEALSIEVAGCKNLFFCQGEVVQEAFSAEVAGCKTIFQIWNFFLKFNLKIL